MIEHLTLLTLILSAAAAAVQLLHYLISGIAALRRLLKNRSRS